MPKRKICIRIIRSHYEFHQNLSGRASRLRRGNVSGLFHLDFRIDGHCRVDGEERRGQPRVDPQDRLFGDHHRLPFVRSAGGAEPRVAATDAAVAAVAGVAGDRSRCVRRPDQGHLPSYERRGRRGRNGPAGGVARSAGGIRPDGQVHRRLQRGLFAGAVLPRLGGRQDLHAARRRHGLVGTFDEPDVLQGAVRQARPEGRGVPSHGVQIQERRGTLYSRQNVGREPRTDAGAGQFRLGYDFGHGGRGPRHRLGGSPTGCR